MTPRGRAARALRLAGTHRATALMALMRTQNSRATLAELDALLRTRRDAVGMAREWIEEAARVRGEVAERAGFRVLAVIEGMVRGRVPLPNGRVMVATAWHNGWAVE